jgi:vesicle-fusing ATPase
MNAQDTWSSRNQQTLAAAMRRVRDRIEFGPSAAAHTEAEPIWERSALDRVVRVFGLTAFERDILLMCAGPELDSLFPAQPSFGLALATLADPHWSAVSPQAPLRWWRLLDVAEDAPVTAARLRISEPVLQCLAGTSCLDVAIAGALRSLSIGGEPPPTQAKAAAAAAAALEAGDAVQLVGQASEVETVAAAASRAMGLPIFVTDLALLPQRPEPWLRLWQRDCLLSPAVLLLDCGGCEQPETLRALAGCLRTISVPILLSAPRAQELPGFLPRRIRVAKPVAEEQAALWRAALPGSDASDEATAEIERAVSHFDLGASAIAAAAAVAEFSPARIWRACRAQAAAESDHVVRASGVARWDDLAVPAAQEAILREMAAQIRHRHTVHHRWGFARSTCETRGLGATALFWGPSGTGKSLAAEIIASELDLDLHVIDLSRVVSKWLGETERHLRTVFDAAEASGAVLLFDEADALFGARGEVRDSHDRYANMEVSYLLQRMEQHRGLAILTTNMRDAIDPAFLRRIRFVVEFTHPGPAERLRQWQTAFPPDAPREAIDPVRLAQANLTGAQIRNVALAAAFLAAESDQAIRMTHLLHAAQRECAKLQRPLTQAEVAGWL